MARDHAGATPLHLAATGHIDAANWLAMSALLSSPSLPAEAALTAADKNGLTPLHYAAGSCQTHAHLSIVKWLVARPRISMDAADSLGMTPLHHAAASSTQAELISTLVKHGAYSDAVNKYGDTILHTAAGSANSNLEVVQALVRRFPAGLSQTNNAGYTPVQLAAVTGWSTSIVKFLLEVEDSQQDGYVDWHQYQHAASRPLQQDQQERVTEFLRHQQRTRIALLDLMVTCGWRLDIADMLLLQAFTAGAAVHDIWLPLRLLSREWKESASGSGKFWPKLRLRFYGIVSPRNSRLRRHLLVRLSAAAVRKGELLPAFALMASGSAPRWGRKANEYMSPMACCQPAMGCLACFNLLQPHRVQS